MVERWWGGGGEVVGRGAYILTIAHHSRNSLTHTCSHLDVLCNIKNKIIKKGRQILIFI